MKMNLPKSILWELITDFTCGECWKGAFQYYFEDELVVEESDNQVIISYDELEKLVIKLRRECGFEFNPRQLTMLLTTWEVNCLDNEQLHKSVQINQVSITVIREELANQLIKESRKSVTED